jgi:hypothetical protein
MFSRLSILAFGSLLVSGVHAVILSHNARATSACPNISVISPLYIYPTSTSVWQPLVSASTANPSVPLQVVINPGNGSGSSTPDPCTSLSKHPTAARSSNTLAQRTLRASPTYAQTCRHLRSSEFLATCTPRMASVIPRTCSRTLQTTPPGRPRPVRTAFSSTRPRTSRRRSTSPTRPPCATPPGTIPARSLCSTLGLPFRQATSALRTTSSCSRTRTLLSSASFHPFAPMLAPMLISS